jgi:formylglycine-generating enzyme required for sulfatase activity
MVRKVQCPRVSISPHKRFALLAIVFFACSPTPTSDDGGTVDSSVESGKDSSTDSGMDAHTDGDASTDSAVDAGVDADLDADADADSADSGIVAEQSCAPGGAGMTSCGDGGESCCTSPTVDGGTFFRTYTNVGDGGTSTADSANISSFRLDKYEVTVGRFRQFVGAWNGGAGWLPPAGTGKHTHLNAGKGLENSGKPGTYETGWLTSDNGNIGPTNSSLVCNSLYATWTSSATTHENLPINCVNWWEAYAFCIWDGGFIPSEAEWRYAAAGGSEQREYPWGSTAPGTASTYAIYGCFYPTSSGTCTDTSNIAPVGSAPSGTGAWGQLDLAGNVSEWILDWYAAYATCTDCAYLTLLTAARMFAGGNFENAAFMLLPSDREDLTPTARSENNGFRCARTP